MFAQLPVYQFQGASAYKANLDNILLFAEHLRNPEKKLNFIHIAGTNGKGSTSHMLASILQEAGYNVGLYTSPHLKDFRERIKINGREIPKDFLVDFINTHKPFLESNNLSFFEMSVGLAFAYFEKEEVDIAIIEVGLGGRLDATNIITPLVSVITNIGIDHTQFLGTTEEAIASEKAGIIKPGVPVVIGEYTSVTKKVFKAKAAEKESAIHYAKTVSQNYESDLKGSYQEPNKKTAVKAIQILQSISDFKISENQIINGLQTVSANTGLRGRWEKLHENPTVVCDTAHNRHGLEVVLKQVSEQKFDLLHIVLGVVNDKDLDEILPLFPSAAQYYFCKPEIFRGLDAGVLQHEAAQYDLIGEIYDSVSAAYSAAMSNASADDFIFIGGSTFVVAEIL